MVGGCSARRKAGGVPAVRFEKLREMRTATDGLQEQARLSAMMGCWPGEVSFRAMVVENRDETRHLLLNKAKLLHLDQACIELA